VIVLDSHKMKAEVRSLMRTALHSDPPTYNAWSKRYRAAKRSLGLCQRHGCYHPTEGQTRCQHCRKRNNDAQRRLYAARLT
jgi:hypothetical protein